MSMFIVMGEAGPIQNYGGPNVFLNPNFQTRPGMPQPQPVAAAPPPRRRVVCRYFRVGICKKGPNCPFLHTSEAAPNESSQTQAAAPSMECPGYPTRKDETVSLEKTCCICLENVLDYRASTTRRKFGLLENCDHCFCHQCIMGYWKQPGYGAEMRRQCPTCRAPFCLITPSMYWPESAEKKRYLIEIFRKSLKSKPCVFFNKGKGLCTAGNSCFYSHALPVMKEEEVESVSMQERGTKEKRDGQDSHLQEVPVPTDENLPSTVASRIEERIPVGLSNPRRRGRRSSTAPAPAMVDLPPTTISNTAPAPIRKPQPEAQGPTASPASVGVDLPPGIRAMMSDKPPAKASDPQPGAQGPTATPASVGVDLPPGIRSMMSDKPPAKASNPQPEAQGPTATPASVGVDLPPGIRGMMSDKPQAKASNPQPEAQGPTVTPASLDKDLPLGMSGTVEKRIPGGHSKPRRRGRRSSTAQGPATADVPAPMINKKAPTRARKPQSGDQSSTSTPASVDEDLPPGIRGMLSNKAPARASNPQPTATLASVDDLSPGIRGMMSNRPPARASNQQPKGQGPIASPASLDEDLPLGMRGTMGKKIPGGHSNPRRRGRRSSTAQGPATADVPPPMINKKAPTRARKPPSGDQSSTSTPASVDEDLPPGIRGMLSDRPPARASNPQPQGQEPTETQASLDEDLPPGMRGM